MSKLRSAFWNFRKSIFAGIIAYLIYWIIALEVIALELEAVLTIEIVIFVICLCTELLKCLGFFSKKGRSE